jgi:hypothetical protein
VEHIVGNLEIMCAHRTCCAKGRSKQSEKIIQYDKIMLEAGDTSLGDVHKSQCNDLNGNVLEELDELNDRHTCFPC